MQYLAAHEALLRAAMGSQFPRLAAVIRGCRFCAALAILDAWRACSVRPIGNNQA